MSPLAVSTASPLSYAEGVTGIGEIDVGKQYSF